MPLNVENPLIFKLFHAIVIYVNKIINLRGRVKFPTGGKVRDLLYSVHSTKIKQLIWCDSITDSKVWMREDKKSSAEAQRVIRYV